MSVKQLPMVTLVGPTASGKTKLAVAVASALNAEIISADSRQVYRGMDIGTGKDLNEYCLNGKLIPYHLIDISDAGSKYNVYEFQHDFLNTWKKLNQNNVPVVLCGGTGLYVESILKGYRLVAVPENTALRQELANKNFDVLKAMLASYKKLHNVSDCDTPKRAIRAIEIEEFYKQNPTVEVDFPKIQTLVFGLELSRDVRRKRITERLKSRLDEGLVDEVKRLMIGGVSSEDLLYYGLEYKFVTLFILGELSYQQMFDQLETAIHQFSKRQMTWFRGMEKRGIKIHWLDAMTPNEENVGAILKKLNPIG